MKSPNSDVEFVQRCTQVYQMYQASSSILSRNPGRRMCVMLWNLVNSAMFCNETLFQMKTSAVVMFFSTLVKEKLYFEFLYSLLDYTKLILYFI